MPSEFEAEHFDREAVVAAADLIGRTGAKSFQIGFLHDDVPSEQAAWYAHAQYRGARVTVENRRSPDDAADALAKRLIDGGWCTHCRRRVTLGREHPAQCRWFREEKRWVRGCE